MGNRWLADGIRGESIRLDAFFPNSDYLWQDGSTQSYFNVTKGGSYSVNVSNSCGDTTAISIVTIKNCACKFYIPSAFTPNGDGKNDIFKPEYQCQFSNYEMKIFNRWGHLIFDTYDSTRGWNGKFKNMDQAMGIYLYMIDYKDNLTGLNVHKKGTVVLIR